MFVDFSTAVAHWDFRRESLFSSITGSYTLQPMTDNIAQTEAGLYLRRGGWLRVPRADLGPLNICGVGTQVTVVAHVYRLPQPETYDCETIAGVWDESSKKRQYCLFLDLPIWDSADQVGGHVSSHGGPTPGFPYCMDAAIGATPVKFGQWTVVGFTYDGTQAVAYLNGNLDTRAGRNPFHYPEGLFDGGADGADFTVGGVSRSGEPGNFFHGIISQLAVFPTALSVPEMAAISDIWHASDMPVSDILA